MEKKYEKLLADYLAGNASQAEEKEIKAAISAGQLEPDYLGSLSRVDSLLAAAPVPAPSEQMRSNFYQMLAEEKRKSQVKPSWISWLKEKLSHHISEFSFGQLAYGVILLGLGVILGLNTRPEENTDDEKLAALTTEMQQLKKMMMLTLLEQPTATERLKAVSLTTDMEQADDKVIKSLLQTLNHDPSVNVRLSAIEALYQHAENPLARAGLVGAISQQDSPLVQLALADVMVAMQEKTSVKPLKQLLRQEGLNQAVKVKVEESLQILI